MAAGRPHGGVLGAYRVGDHSEQRQLLGGVCVCGGSLSMSMGLRKSYW